MVPVKVSDHVATSRLLSAALPSHCGSLPEHVQDGALLLKTVARMRSGARAVWYQTRAAPLDSSSAALLGSILERQAVGELSAKPSSHWYVQASGRLLRCRSHVRFLAGSMCCTPCKREHHVQQVQQNTGDVLHAAVPAQERVLERPLGMRHSDALAPCCMVTRLQQCS